MPALALVGWIIGLPILIVLVLVVLIVRALW